MPDRIALKPQYGSDFLAVPVGKEHLFSKRKVEKGSAIRQDIFRAFSYFGAGQLPFYDRTTDRVTTFETAPDDAERYVAITPRTIEAEIELRRQFATGLTDSKLSAQLSKDLSVPQRELANFSWTIRSSGHQDDWYAFKNRDILERIRDWASSNAIQWNENWIEPRAGQYRETPSGYTTKIDLSSVIPKLIKAISMLSDEDKRRISIPLDIVVRLLDE